MLSKKRICIRCVALLAGLVLLLGVFSVVWPSPPLSAGDPALDRLLRGLHAQRPLYYDVLERRPIAWFTPATWLQNAHMAWTRTNSYRALAVWKLTNLGTNAWPAIPSLVEALRDRDCQVGFAAASALAGMRAEDSPQWAQAESALRGNRRAAKAFAYLLTGRDAGGRAYDLNHRRFALLGLTMTGRAGWVAQTEISDILKSEEDPRLRSKAVLAAAAVAPDPTRITPLLKPILQDQAEWPEVRAAAAHALARTVPKDPETRVLLQQALRDERAMVRLEAARSLWTLKAPTEEVLPVLQPLLSHKLVSVRSGTLKALAEMGAAARPCVPVIQQLAANENEMIRKESAAALERITGSQATAGKNPNPRNVSGVETSPNRHLTVVTNGESKARSEECRGVIVGQGVNQPDPFPGYAGFVGWESPIRLTNGTWLVGFNAGYWHASVSTPMQYTPAHLEEYRKLGMPTNVVAPTGGRAMITRSLDEGKTWSKPETLIDTPADDRHPAFVQLQDGTVLCCFFIYNGDEPEVPSGSVPPPHIFFIRSFDGGKTWEKKPIPLGTPWFHETDGPFAKLKDGSVLLAINGRPQGPPDQCGIFRATDRGETWQLLSTIKAAHDLQECTVAELPDGRWVMMARPEGDISWSSDHGKTWTPPVTFGMRMYAPSLCVLRDGTLLCLHGSYSPGHNGLRVIFSTDGGHTWIAPGKDYGFLVDHSYGYGKAMELPDGSLFISYIATGGHRGSDAAQNEIWGIRLRIRPDHSGIDLLPAPNRR